MGSSKMMDKALDITAAQLNRSPVLISSAMSKITDSLVSISQMVEQGEEDKVNEVLESIIVRHVSTAKDFLSGENLTATLNKLDSIFKELSSLTRGLCLLKECSPRSLDTLLSFGEILSTTLLAARAKERGIKCHWLDSRKLMATDSEYNAANPDFEKTNQQIKEKIKPSPGTLYIAQGFIASAEDGTTTTLGRGGSDFSATIFGAALAAEEVQIWTDVPGIMTCDPRLIKSAAPIPSISYEEAAELAYFGAKVVHPSTIMPAVDLKIPVMVKDTNSPEAQGTAIIADAKGKGLRAIAMKKDVTCLNVNSSRMLNAFGFLNRIFAIFHKYKTSVDLVSTSEVSVSMTLDNIDHLEEIIPELQKIADTSLEKGASIISLVGQQLWKDSSFVAAVFSALKGIPIHMITLGASDINLSLVVPQEYMEEAVQKLHTRFFEQ